MNSISLRVPITQILVYCVIPILIISLFFGHIAMGMVNGMPHKSITPTSRIIYVVQGEQIISADTVDLAENVRLIVEFTAPPLAVVAAERKNTTGLEMQIARSLIDRQHDMFQSDLTQLQTDAVVSGKISGSQSVADIEHTYRNSLNGVALTCPRWLVAEVAKLDYVKGVHKDKEVRIVDEVSNNVIRADSVWSQLGITGRGVVVGIFDTGIDHNHPDLGGGIGPNYKVIAGFTFVGDGNILDVHGHGTHVAGIVAANGSTLKGVAPDAKLMTFKVLNDGGIGYDAWIIAGIERALDPDGDPNTNDAVDVINMSLGGRGSPDDALCRAIDIATRAGIVFIVAAGNSGPTYWSVGSPGLARFAITVGATDNADNMAFFSSRGPATESYDIKPEIVAPGVGINSTWPGGGYSYSDGTSMATPHVAGAAALLLERYPNLAPDMVKAALMQSTRDLGFDLWTQGTGRLDAYNAVTLNQIITPATLNLGVSDLTQAIWTYRDTLVITNTSTQPSIYSFSFFSSIAGVSISFNPPTVVVNPSAFQYVVVEFSVNNSIVPVNDISSADWHPHTGTLLAVGGEDTITLPFSFVKAPYVILSSDITGYDNTVIVHDRTSQVWYSSTLDHVFTGRKILIGSDACDVLSVLDWWGAPKFIAFENLNTTVGTQVSISHSLAVHQYYLQLRDHSGRLIDLSPSYITENNYMGQSRIYHKNSNVGIETFGRMYSQSFKHSNISSLYKCDWYITGSANTKPYIAWNGTFDDFSTSRVFSNSVSDLKQLGIYYKLPVHLNEVRVQQLFYGFIWYEDNFDPYLRAPFVQPTYLLPEANMYHWPPAAIKAVKQSRGIGVPYSYGTPVFYWLPDLRVKNLTTNAAFVFGDQYASLEFGANRIVYGLGPTHWFGKFENSPTTIMLRANGDGAYTPHSYDEDGNIFFYYPFFLNQLQDASPKPWLEFTLSDEHGSQIVGGNFFEWNVCTPEGGIVTIQLPTSGRYVLETSDTASQVSNTRGQTFVRTIFDTRLIDKNPPDMKSLIVLADEEFTDVKGMAQSARIQFSVGDDDALNSVNAYYRMNGDTSWLPVSLDLQGEYYSANIPSGLPPGFLSFRVVASDQSGNRLEYEARPALRVAGNATPFPRHPAVADTFSANPTLRWSKVGESIAYHAQVSRDLHFASVAIDQGMISDTFYIPVAELRNCVFYHWRVRVDSTFGGSEWSDTWTFIKVGVPDTPELIYPPNNSDTLDTAFIFRWEASGFSVGEEYKFQLSSDSLFTSNFTNYAFYTNHQGFEFDEDEAYYWRVKAVNSYGESDWSEIRYFKVTPFPETPDLIDPPGRFNAASPVKLTWQRPVGGKMYELQIAEDNAFANIVHVDTTLIINQSFVTDLEYTKQYYWRVRAKNHRGISDFSSTHDFSIAALHLQPPILEGPQDSTRCLQIPLLSWSKPEGSSSYHVQISRKSDFQILSVDQTGITDTSFTFLGTLVNNAFYHWRVRIDSAHAPWSDSKIFIKVGIPEQTVLLTPENGSLNLGPWVSITWNPSEIYDEENYEIATAWDSLFTINYSLSHWRSYSIPVGFSTYFGEGVKIYWKVRSVNSYGTGAWSEVWNFSTYSESPDTPVLVSPVNGSTNLPRDLTFVWNSLRGRMYYFQIAEDELFNNIVVSDSQLTEATQHIEGLLPNKTYYWRVRSWNSSGLSEYSEIFNFRTIGASQVSLKNPPCNSTDQPIIITFQWQDILSKGKFNDYAKNKVNISDEIENIDVETRKESYLIKKSNRYWFELTNDTTSMSGFIQDTTITDTLIVISDLNYSSEYFWRVKSKIDSSWGDFSEWCDFTTEAYPYLTAPWGLTFEYISRDTIVYPYDGNPKVVARIVNTSPYPSPILTMWFSSPDYPTWELGGFAVFPNGGHISLAPNETTYVSHLTSNVFHLSTPPPNGYFTRNFELNFRRVHYDPQFVNDTSVHTISKHVVFNNIGHGVDPSGPMPIIGSVILNPDLGVSNLRIEVATVFSHWYNLNYQIHNDSVVFSSSLPDRDDWYMRITSNNYETQFFKLIPGTTADMRIILTPKTTNITFNYNLTQAITTPSGFWRGAVSELERTVTFFPGQENWRQTGNNIIDSTLRASCKMYKYTFNGMKLWEHSPGWEIWGGDMSTDGQYVVYALNPTFHNFYRPTEFKLVLLNGNTGQMIWEKTGPSNEPSGMIYASLEVSISNNNNYIAVGSTGQGYVTLIELATGNILWTIPTTDLESFGQVRKLKFDPTDTYVYAGSGDNYLRKILVLDGSIIWKSHVGGWPFVNGLSFSPDGNYIATGTKSLDASVVRASDGRPLWQWETQSADALYSPDGNLITMATGLVLSAGNGNVVGMNKEVGASQFSNDNENIFRVDQDVKVFDIYGSLLYESEIYGGAGNVNWAYLSRDNQNIIVAVQGMNNPPHIGIAFYQGSKTSTPILAPDVPLQLYPLNGATAVSHLVQFRWSQSAMASSYRIQISLNSLFNTLVYDTTLYSDTCAIFSGLEEQTSYYWRVSSRNFIGTSGWSDIWRFTTNVDPPEVPNLRVPNFDATNVPLRPIFIWEVAAGANSYQLQVSKYYDFSIMVVDTSGLVDTLFNMSDMNPLESLTDYYWRVHALNQGGNSTSVIRRFTTKADPYYYPPWGLTFESISQDTVVYPFDGKPKVVVKISNNTAYTSPTLLMSFSSPDYPTWQGGGFATFPNGGSITLAPGDTTHVSHWTNGVWEQGELPLGYFARDFDLTFRRAIGDTTSYTVRKRVVFNNLGNITQPNGPMPLTGKIYNFQNIQPQNIRMEVTTPGADNWYNVILAQDPDGHRFSTSLPIRNDWHLRIRSDNYESKIIRLNPDSTTNLNILISPKTSNTSINYQLTNSITTPTGFWRGAVSESEGTVVFIPGQENWKTTNDPIVDSTLRASSKIYKYTFDGTLLWEHSPGWEIWGGDMSPDGRYVVYSLNPTRHNFYNPVFKLVLLNGHTGQVIWENIGPNIYEALEASISNNGNYIAVGTTAGGKVTLIESATGNILWSNPENYGQVRKLKFDATDNYLYVGSGDNYLRKLNVSDGVLQWKALIGGWPFVNGLSITPDGNYVITGAKSFDQTVVRASDGYIMWRKETGSLDAVVSPDGNLTGTFTGWILNVNSGNVEGLAKFNATSHFSSDSKYMFKLDRNVSVYDRTGVLIYSSLPSGIGMGAGEQAQWSYVSRDNQKIIIAGRDMGNPPQVGLAFYNGSIINTSLPGPDIPLLINPLNNTTWNDSTIMMRWGKTKGATSYHFQLSTDSLFSIPLIDEPIITDTFRVISNLSIGQIFYWQVRAKNFIGESDWSEVWNFRTIIADPSVPVLVSPANNATGVSVNPSLSWTASDRGDSYILQVSISNDFNSTVVNDSGLTVLTYNVSGLNNLTQYYWRVKSVNIGGESDWSEVWNFTTIITVPSIPVLVSPANNATGVSVSPSLSWTASDRAESYILQVSVSNDFNSTVVNDSGLTTLTYSVSGLNNLTQYYWRVKSVNVSGESDWSEVWNFTTLIAAPSVPVLASPVPNGTNIPTTIVFKWNKVSGSDTYRLQISKNDQFTTNIFDDSTLVDTLKQIIELENNTVYFWRVNAKNIGGTSDWSEVWSFTTIVNLPDQVVLVSPLNNAILSSDTVKFVWNKSSPAVDCYWVEYTTDSLFVNTIIDSSVTDTFSVKQLLNNQRYWWRIRSKNVAGWGAYSEISTFSIMITSVSDGSNMPYDFGLSQNYPNPFNPSTIINYQLPINSNVTLKVFDVLGKEVATLVDGYKEAGYYNVKFESTSLSSGIYFYRIQSRGFVDVKKLILMK